MTEIYRRVTRLDPTVGLNRTQAAMECGHRDTYLTGFHPPLGAERRCFACERVERLKTVTPVIDGTVNRA